MKSSLILGRIDDLASSVIGGWQLPIRTKPIPRWDVHFGGLEDDREDSTAPHITFSPQMGDHRQCGLAICTFHLGFSLECARLRGQSFGRPLPTDGGNLPSTIDKYLVQIQEAEVPLGIYAYRGQGRAEWKLHSAATRLLVREYGDSITAEAEFRKLYVDYHRDTLIGSARTRGLGVEIGRRLNDWELLAKLQHFGAPTGLLDFSWSPLVALWFGCEDPENDGKLFMVDTGDPMYAAQLQTDTEHHDLASVLSGTQVAQQMSYWEPAASGDASTRILRQRSLFIVGRPLVHVDGRTIKALRIAQEDKNQLLAELKTLDVDQESLFLDIHGFAEAVQRRRLPDLTPVAHVRTANRFYQQGQYEEAIHHYTSGASVLY